MRSIRTLVFTGLFASVLGFFVAAAAVVAFVVDRTIHDSILDESSTLVSFVAFNIKSTYLEQLKAAERLAAMRGFSPFEQASAQRTVEEFLQFDNIFGTVHVYRSDGRLLFARRRASVAPYVVEPSFRSKPDPEYIQRADRVLAGRVPLATRTFSTSAGELYQTYLVPIADPEKPGRVFGILSGGVFPLLKRLDPLLTGLNLGAGNCIVVCDARGNVLGRGGISPGESVAGLADHLRAATSRFFAGVPRAGQEPVFVEDAIAGRSHVFLSVPVKELEIVVTLGLAAATITARRNLLMKYFFLALVAGLLASLLVSVHLGNRLARPLGALADGIRQLIAGNFSHRIGHRADDEVGAVSRLVDDLAAKLEKDRFLGDLWNAEDEADRIARAEVEE
ncbi:MAG: methyl-accepting chemotaxis protein [Candidatus Riflebacteria bacterium]|nr:methyl-accepting chemotaxis protein [Candidatus Riflebacteria bacterium]